MAKLIIGQELPLGGVEFLAEAVPPGQEPGVPQGQGKGSVSPVVSLPVPGLEQHCLETACFLQVTPEVCCQPGISKWLLKPALPIQRSEQMLEPMPCSASPCHPADGPGQVCVESSWWSYVFLGSRW